MSGDPVPMPVELRDALAAEPEASEVFDLLSPSHRREHIAYVAEAKRPETRVRRAIKTVNTLLGSERPNDR